MIGDAADIEPGSTLESDICIVGAGAAGITLALSLLECGLSVLLLESGGLGSEPASQALYDGSVADARLHSPANTYRRRGFGGSTTLWGGRCVPFDPIDFEARPWISGPGWPIGADALAPWYPAANALCEAGRFAYTAAEAFPHGVRPMLAGFQGGDFTDTTLERFSCPTDFGVRYRARLAQSRSLRVLLHANVVELRTRPDGASVESLDVRSLGGRRFQVRPRITVLAVGGLEVPRLLLASRDHQPAGIGNVHDQVGRTYMCHIAGTLGALAVSGGPGAVWHGYDVADDGTYCRRRFALTATAQRRKRVGNFIARLHHPRIPDPSHRTGALSALYFAKPFIGYEYAKRLAGEDRLSPADMLRHARNIAFDLPDTARFLLHWARHRTLAARKYPSVIVAPKTQLYTVDFNAEQEPNPLSRITLTADRDALGMQRILVDWRYSNTDIRTVTTAFAGLARELAVSGCASLTYDPDEVVASILRDGAYGGHHIGTSRMSESASTGIVDTDCRVHGMHNLFVAGSAVFPTSSQANPTLTIVTMALRLAAHLAAAEVTPRTASSLV